MNDAEFRLLDEIEESHWWFVGKRLLLQALLADRPVGGHLLDLGCGTGGILRAWTDQTRCVGIDRSPLALRICARRGFSALVRAELTHPPFRESSFDTLVLMDVLEHLDDDVGFLRSVAPLCRSGGHLVISVPAFQSLWSQHDETFEHRRRYRAAALEAVVRSAGLVPERITYTNGFIFPVAALWRILSFRAGLGRFAPKHDFWAIPAWLNALLIRAYRLEAWLLKHLDLPVGVSVVCIARGPNPDDGVVG